jgi:hypothetical protein
MSITTELIPDYLTEPQATAVFAAVDAEFQTAPKFTGIDPATKKSIHYGRKTVEKKPEGKLWLTIRPLDTLPAVLVDLQNRLQQKYDFTFNALQINAHADETGLGRKHYDKPQGPIAMVSVGADGKFWVGGETVDIPHGSLLKFVGKIQHAHAPSPGLRYSLIFRRITEDMELAPTVTIDQVDGAFFVSSSLWALDGGPGDDHEGFATEAAAWTYVADYFHEI